MNVDRRDAAGALNGGDRRRHLIAAWRGLLRQVHLHVATASAPCRGTGSAFSAILYETDPSPWPVASEVTEIHPALLDTVHAHSLATPIASVPLPPPD